MCGSKGRYLYFHKNMTFKMCEELNRLYPGVLEYIYIYLEYIGKFQDINGNLLEAERLLNITFVHLA